MASDVEFLAATLRRIHAASEPDSFIGASDRKRALILIRLLADEALTGATANPERANNGCQIYRGAK